MSLPCEPVEVKALEDYIIDWKEIGWSNFLLIPKNDLHFNKLFIKSHFVALERIVEFSGVIELVPKELMEESYKDLYASLGGLGCELSFRGFSRSPQFKNDSTLNIFQKCIQGLKINNKLVDVLNESDHLIRLIKKTHLDKFFIYLYPLMPLSLITTDKSNLTNFVSNYFCNPAEVHWVVQVNKLYSSNPFFSRTSSYKNDFVNMLKLIEFASQVVLKISYGYAEQTNLDFDKIRKRFSP